MSKAKQRTIHIDQLDLDVSNFRLEAADTQEESIENMLEEQQQKLSNLAQDMLDNGLSPSELLIVVPHPEQTDRFIVCEGNRRLTALRLMQNPRLAKGSAVERDFKRLSLAYQQKPITSVSCVILDTKEDALLWIERKHNTLGGRGLDKWASPATERRDEYKSGKVRSSRAVLDHLRSHALLNMTLEKKLLKRTTTLDRVFQMPYLRTRLGINIDRKANVVTFSNGDTDAGNALMISMLEKLAARDFPVRHLLDSDQRIGFIDDFAGAAVVRREEPPAAVANGALLQDEQQTAQVIGSAITPPGIIKPSATEPQKPATMRPLPSTLDRQTLALRGKEHGLRIRDPRLNNLYGEARKLDADEFPNTAALLIRVFLELSSEFYLTEKKIPIPAKHAGKTHWGEIGLNLDLKIKTVLADLDPSGKEHELLSARQGVSSSDYGHSVTNLHGYIHNRNADADGLEVKHWWERWQPYLKRLFAALT